MERRFPFQHTSIACSYAHTCDAGDTLASDQGDHDGWIGVQTTDADDRGQLQFAFRGLTEGTRAKSSTGTETLAYIKED